MFLVLLFKGKLGIDALSVTPDDVVPGTAHEVSSHPPLNNRVAGHTTSKETRNPPDILNEWM